MPGLRDHQITWTTLACGVGQPLLRASAAIATARVIVSVALLLGACQDATRPPEAPEPEAPESIEALVVPQYGSRPGDTVAARVTVRGLRRQPIPGVQVTFEVLTGEGTADPTGAVTGEDGVAAVRWVLGPQPGLQQLRARATSELAAILSVTARTSPVARLLVLATGYGLRGNVVDSLPAVRVLDDRDLPVAGEPVAFTPAAGSGVVVPGVVLSDRMGVARPGAWRLGPVAGTQVLTASAGAVAADLRVPAGDPPTDQLNIEIRFRGPYEVAESVAVYEAKARWESLLRTHLPDLVVSGPSTPPPDCGIVPGDRIDDVLVVVEFLEESDDPMLGLIGEANLCLVRAESGMPAGGSVTIFRRTLGSGGFELRDVVVHEIGHVLGFNGARPFAGERARQAYALAGGFPPTACGQASLGPLCQGYPPVEAQSYHWSEAVFGHELMTPVALAGFEPLSAVTIAALGDAGYTADEAGADQFVVRLPANWSALAGQGMRDRVHGRPPARITADGLVVRSDDPR